MPDSFNQFIATEAFKALLVAGLFKLMKKLSLFLTLITILFSAQLVWGQGKYNIYNNARFGYSISYPSNLIPKGESTNGDGQIFAARDKSATLTVWGAHNALDQTLKEKYDEVLNEKGKSVTYKTIGSNYYVVSGKAKGKIFYQKTIKGEDDTYFTFIFEYAESKRAAYDKAVAQIAKSFK